MKSEDVDFSSQITEKGLLDPPAYKIAPARLFGALTTLARRFNVPQASLLEVYRRGYLNHCDHSTQGSRSQRALARVLLFIRMEEGKTIPYLYKKLDQNLSCTSPAVFDDGERLPLLFTQAQLIEASLVGRQFGIEHDEEELLLFLKQKV